MGWLCRHGLHRWEYVEGPEHRMAVRTCRGCGKKEQQMGDGALWLEVE